ncbi:hypothetical protein C8R43DRAFT_1132728 [Mycena crocata]|nr:hypothetical protein C8R43DRAFT_1132728 [Mycena crocata]
MVNHRQFVPIHPKTHNIFLRALLYNTSAATPRYVSVLARALTLEPDDTRFPCVESIMSSMHLQPHTHDVLVALRHGSKTSTFKIFFKRHQTLTKNAVFVSVGGEILAMRVAARNNNSVVNLRTGDRRLMKYILTRLSASLEDFQSPRRRRLPSIIKMVKSSR